MLFLDTLLSRTDEGFSESAVSLPSHVLSFNLHNQKMRSTFYTVVNRSFNICSGPISFNTEIQYVKAIALDRGYNLSTADKAIFKFQIPRLSHPFILT